MGVAVCRIGVAHTAETMPSVCLGPFLDRKWCLVYKAGWQASSGRDSRAKTLFSLGLAWPVFWTCLSHPI
jgi:hypothetical protein